LGSALGRWPIALAAVFVLAVLILFSGLGTPGLWEPHERQLSDRAAPPIDKSTEKPAEKPAVAKPPGETCVRIAPEDAAARSLTTRAAKFGRDSFGDSDTGRRLPFALMGLLTALATAGIAMRFGGARAGLLAGIIVLSMPLLSLQARMLTSEIGTACGGALIIYSLVALSRLGAGYGTALAAVDAGIAIASLVLGSWLGFHGGGALLGLVVPIGAVAAAGGLGIQAVTAGLRRERVLPHVPALVATLAVGALIAMLVHELYALRDPTLRAAGVIPPNAREIFGRAIVSEGCWSELLGGLWRVDDDLRVIFDSSFEQIAYGTFPWGVLGPIAMAALLASTDKNQRAAGAISLAWGAGAWIAGEAFQRKVGFTLYAGFPALAIAIGVWLDSVLARRAKGGNGGDPDAAPSGLMLVGLFFLIAVLNLGKDMHSFPDRASSLLVGLDQIPYPKQSTLLFIPTKTWILLTGMLAGLGFGLSMLIWRPTSTPLGRTLRSIGNWAMAVAIAGTVVMAAFWAFVWQPRLSQHLSSKAMFDTYKDLRHSGDPLVIMGDLGKAPIAYADTTPEMVNSREQVVAALGRPNRVFAIAPQTELCALHREVGGKPYYVVDDRNVRNLLLSNKLDGTTDKNPLASAIVHSEPKNIKQRPKVPVIFDRKLELLGWDIPTTMERGSKVEVKLYYKVIQGVGGAWKSLMHFDGPLRFNGDHPPIKDRCPTSTWQPGDYIIDTHTINVGGGAFPRGKYELWIGFFTGSAPNWKNMPISAPQLPSDIRDTADRVKIMTVMLD
ncbi:MAG: glycosyltransferase family 39 protein, partial [Deltaproteobacteria bacterium]|nr:glycosyltransferase family 39 protein [Deltaproteobacteria bacterium]